MTPEEINARIARVCGWRETERSWFAPDGSAWAKHRPDGRPVDPDAVRPDYCGDLNAMHEAEKILTPEQQWPYAQALFRALEAKGVLSTSFATLHATAAERAEAFLRTVGQW